MYVYIDDVAYNVGRICEDDLSVSDLEFLYDHEYAGIPRDRYGLDNLFLKNYIVKMVSRKNMNDKAASCNSPDAVRKAAAHQSIATYLGSSYANVVNSSLKYQNRGQLPRMMFDVYFSNGHQVYFFTELSSVGVESLTICRAN